jgi:hypothetical protein
MSVCTKFANNRVCCLPPGTARTQSSLSPSIRENALDKAPLPKLERHAVLNDILVTIDPYDTKKMGNVSRPDIKDNRVGVRHT